MKNLKLHRNIYIYIYIYAVCGLLLCFYLGVIAYLNLSTAPAFYDTDMYEDVMVSVEMFKEKTPFPSHWIFGNQLYCISTPTLSAVLYPLLGDPYLSMGVASSLAVFALILSFDWMLRAVYSKRVERLVAIVAFLVITAVCGDVVRESNGWQLFFTMCAYYACYAITAFLAFGCFLRARQRVPWGMLGFTAILSFAMGIQSLRQTAVMAVPLACFAGVDFLLRAHRKEKVLSGGVLVAAVVIAANILGLTAKHCLNVTQSEIFGEVSLRPVGDILQHAGNAVTHIFGLFFGEGFFDGGFDDAHYIYYKVACCCKIILYFLFVVVAVAVCRNLRDKRVQPLILMALSVISIFGIDLMLTMRVRSIYYFMLYPLAAVTVAFFFSKGNQGVRAGIVGLLLLLSVYALWKNILPNLEEAKNQDESIYFQMSDDLVDHGISTVYSGWNHGEKVAVASEGKIQAGFWHGLDDTFIPVLHLCNPEVYRESADKAAYLFYSQEEADAAAAKAAGRGVELVLIKSYPKKSIFVYTAQENLMMLFAGE